MSVEIGAGWCATEDTGECIDRPEGLEKYENLPLDPMDLPAK